jgi:mono/diheme cytochrome c family protein
VTRSAETGGLKIQLEITPGRVGINTFVLQASSGGQPVTGAKEVLLRFTPLSANLPPSEIRLASEGNGRYAAKGASLSLPDRWQVQAVVRRPDQFDVYANFQVDASAAAGAPAPMHRIAGILLVLAAAGILLAIALNRPRRLGWLLAAQVIALAFILAGLLVFNRPVRAARAEPVNPVPPSASSAAAGQAVYEQKCAACHGPSGKGDGPVGLTLNPRPADLALHAVPGVHTDGRLFEWISNGYPGSVMPGFAGEIAEVDRWNLVNYLRTFAGQ